jgi:hypothetical protein
MTETTERTNPAMSNDDGVEYHCLYDDPNLLDDPDYTTSYCGLIIHVDDVDEHGPQSDQCELCEELRRRP